MENTAKAADPVVAQHGQALKSLPFHDEQDFADARRGLLGTLDDPRIRDDAGRVVWDPGAYAFLSGPAPVTVHPSLWRQSTLTAMHGLFEVVPGIYQARGLDLSNVTFVEGDRGVLVIDPLISAETAAAALALYRRHRGDRPVTGLIYTHSHVDHFGGARGVLPRHAAAVPVLAPAGFAAHAVSENVYAGTAMGRRAVYMYGATLPRGAAGQVGTGLGAGTSAGTVTLIPPTVDITRTGQEETVDGVRMVFQMAPASEAPAEMHLWFPGFRALCMAENATHNLHNILTLRGAEVRDPHAWSGYLTEAIDLFGGEAEVVFASHHWPTWGNERVVEFLSVQRDLYAYLHDQTVRLLNQGLTGPEIAEAVALPPALEQAWHARGNYGSVSHNVRAVYQRYLGFYDGNPAHLWPHPPVEAGRRYVRAMGGPDAVVAIGRDAYRQGDYRWAAEVLNHLVFAEPGHTAARQLLADVYDQLGYGAENGTWRCEFLTAALELRHGVVPTPITTGSPDLIAQLTPQQLFDTLAIRVNGPRCWGEHLTVDVDLIDAKERWRLTLRNGVLTYTRKAQPDPAGVTLHLPLAALPALAAGAPDPAVTIEGDRSVLGRLRAALDDPEPNFPIVTP
ncbi:MBL fold metallo-hydrolase [Actinoplanes sp. KI2]|uniref:alkyl/aryl-sulfatase n=1 Tax=Actinoplanes sp. KI2 TaxID=2983315 RepID=UPI0021D60DE4|nr:alkyl sulfatase dimerization domain-containing protein [Actinoplanes sp. KI2]MCU7727640.1 MBL fold metallo-hydrolase [Actinoplanes sp. KI2]